jgi:hypothetical protein
VEAEPAAEPGAEAEAELETRWFLHEHVWLAAAPNAWSAMSTESGAQLSITRTCELQESGDGNFFSFLVGNAEFSIENEA